MLKNRNIIIAFLLCFLLTACTNTGKNNDKAENQYDKEITATIDGFVKEMRDFNIAGFLQYTTPDKLDEEKINNQLPNDELFKIQTEYLKKNASQITYKIEEVKEKDNKVLAKIKFRYVDMSSILENTLNEYSEETEDKNIAEKEKDKILENILKREISESTPVYIEKIVKVEHIKINDKWYINNLNDDLIDVMLSDYLETFDKLKTRSGN